MAKSLPCGYELRVSREREVGLWRLFGLEPCDRSGSCCPSASNAPWHGRSRRGRSFLAPSFLLGGEEGARCSRQSSAGVGNIQGTIFSSPRACRSQRSCPPRVNSTRRPFSAASPASTRSPRRSPRDGFLRARGVTQRVARSMRRHAIDIRRTGDWGHSQSTSSLHDGAKRRVPIPRVARFADVVHALNANEHFC